jgi:hypothetical protein
MNLVGVHASFLFCEAPREIHQSIGEQSGAPRSKKGRMASHPTLLRVGEKEARPDY